MKLKTAHEQLTAQFRSDAKAELENEISRQRDEIRNLQNEDFEKAKEKQQEYHMENKNLALVWEHEKVVREFEGNLEQIKADENEMAKLCKIIERKNYETLVPEPDFLSKHKRDNPKSFYI